MPEIPDKIDRMDLRGLFTSHYKRTLGDVTLCGLAYDRWYSQKYNQNGFCARCLRIAAKMGVIDTDPHVQQIVAAIQRQKLDLQASIS